MSSPIYLVAGHSQPVSVRIANPPDDTRIPATHFIAYGYVTPGDVDKLRGWLQHCRNPRRQVRGQPVLYVPPPFDWGFAFSDVPALECFKLVVEAEDVQGLTTRAVHHILCRPPAYLTVQIGTPANGGQVTR